MLGAIIGDIIGSTYEFRSIKRKDFKLFTVISRFTDDSALTVATADALLHKRTYLDVYRQYAHQYMGRGYGVRFMAWVYSGSDDPYNSFGNGSAMRVSPVAWAFDTLDEVLAEAKKSAEVTHNHPEGIKGAQAVASAIFLARTGTSKEAIKQYIETEFQYDLHRTVDEVRKTAVFNESCQMSVPEAIICFLESTSFEDTIRNAVSLGADADTQACIAGAIAEAFYKEIPKELMARADALLDEGLMVTVQQFREKFRIKT